MIHFLAIHLRRILAFSFVLGALTIVLRLLDEHLPARHKKSFELAVDNLTLRIDALTLESCYSWLYKYQKGLKICFGLLVLSAIPVCAAGFVFTPAHHIILFRLCFLFVVAWVLLFGPVAFILKVFGRESGSFDESSARVAKSSWRIFRWTLPITICLGILFVYIPLPSPLDGYLFIAGAFLIVLAILLAAAFLLMVSPHVLIKTLTLIASRVARLCWWMATYPKGAWAAFIYLTTMAAGIFRLLLGA